MYFKQINSIANLIFIKLEVVVGKNLKLTPVWKVQ